MTQATFQIISILSRLRKQKKIKEEKTSIPTESKTGTSWKATTSTEKGKSGTTTTRTDITTSALTMNLSNFINDNFKSKKANAKNKKLLRQILNPRLNYLDEDAMVMAIDKQRIQQRFLHSHTSVDQDKSSMLRICYKKYSQYGKNGSNEGYYYCPPPPPLVTTSTPTSRRNNRRGGTNTLSSTTSSPPSPSALQKFSYPFYLSSSSSSSSSSSDFSSSDYDDYDNIGIHDDLVNDVAETDAKNKEHLQNKKQKLRNESYKEENKNCTKTAEMNKISNQIMSNKIVEDKADLLIGKPCKTPIDTATSATIATAKSDETDILKQNSDKQSDYSSGGGSVSVDGGGCIASYDKDTKKNNPKPKLRKRKKHYMSRRLTRGMARNIEYRRKEVKEARDLMGLVALLSAAEELQNADDINNGGNNSGSASGTSGSNNTRTSLRTRKLTNAALIKKDHQTNGNPVKNTTNETIKVKGGKRSKKSNNPTTSTKNNISSKSLQNNNRKKLKKERDVTSLNPYKSVLSPVKARKNSLKREYVDIEAENDEEEETKYEQQKYGTNDQSASTTTSINVNSTNNNDINNKKRRSSASQAVATVNMQVDDKLSQQENDVLWAKLPLSFFKPDTATSRGSRRRRESKMPKIFGTTADAESSSYNEQYKTIRIKINMETQTQINASFGTPEKIKKSGTVEKSNVASEQKRRKEKNKSSKRKLDSPRKRSSASEEEHSSSRNTTLLACKNGLNSPRKQKQSIKSQMPEIPSPVRPPSSSVAFVSASKTTKSKSLPTVLKTNKGKTTHVSNSNDMLDDPYGSALHSYLSQDNITNASIRHRQPISLSLLDWRRRQQWIPMTPSLSSAATGVASTDGNNHFNNGYRNKSLSNTIEVGTPISALRQHALASTPLTAQTSTTTATNTSPNELLATDVTSPTAGIPSSMSKTWQPFHPGVANDIPKLSSSGNLQRRRHKDDVYGNWCCELVHCLSGSGRSNAHYEFFYSDIDRAWFNFNEYKVDVVKLGVPVDAKLTRKEWSLVRRQIPNRPRRFSQRFIKSQLEKLERYRDCVRNIQHRPDDDTEAIPNFPFEVPAPIKIGAPVTAFNKKARVLHRGIVLTRDPFGKRYMIQFERSELGCEFCPDTEVASHGIPKMLRHCTEIAFDGTYIGGFSSAHAAIGALPYGTTYGPLTGFQKKQNQAPQRPEIPRKKEGIARSLDYDLIEASDDEGDGEADDSIEINKNKSSGPDINFPNLSDSIGSDRKRIPLENTNTRDTSRIDDAVERECLIKLIGVFNAMTERKTQILDALDACYRVIETGRVNQIKKDKKGTPNETPSSYQEKVECSDDLLEHHAWLQANLELTNQSLQGALVHLQIMYGKAYANRFYSVDKNQQGKQPSLEQTSIDNLGSCSASWLKNFSSKCEDVSNSISESWKETTQVGSNVKSPRLTYIENRFTSSAHLLLSLHLLKDHHCNLNPPSRLKNGENTMDSSNILLQQERKLVGKSHIGLALNESLLRLVPPVLPLDHRVNKFENARMKGFCELRDALRIFYDELDANRREVIVK